MDTKLIKIGEVTKILGIKPDTLLKKLKKSQQQLSQKQKGSNRSARAKLKVAKLHFRISNQHQAVLHELSDHLSSLCHLILLSESEFIELKNFQN